MAPDQDLQTGTEQTDTAAPAEGPRPPRRSGRGHRGRGRRRRGRAPRPESSAEPAQEKPDIETAKSEEASETEQGAQAAVETPETEATPREHPVPHTAAPEQKGQRAPKANIQDAIEQVNQIISSLKESLEQMDEVLELLEYFERQGDADEREIDSLRRTLRQLQRPRDEGRHSHHGRS